MTILYNIQHNKYEGVDSNSGRKFNHQLKRVSGSTPSASQLLLSKRSRSTSLLTQPEQCVHFHSGSEAKVMLSRRSPSSVHSSSLQSIPGPPFSRQLLGHPLHSSSTPHKSQSQRQRYMGCASKLLTSATVNSEQTGNSRAIAQKHVHLH